MVVLFFFKQKTAYEMRISDWSSDVCSSDLPVGSATWLATEMDEDGILFGLADLGFGCPELGRFAMAELEAVRLPFGLGIERDLGFTPHHPLSVYAAAARSAGSILPGERRLDRKSGVWGKSVSGRVET